ncbi:MAG: acetyltransferase [Gammaproteobacteria bacterium]|nr:acetyltransferase [Gammaproteobacteria bacterium]
MGLLLIGGGGHAKVLIDALQTLRANLLGVVDPGLSAGTGNGPLGLDVLGGDDVIKDYDPQNTWLVNGIGSMPGDKGVRSELFLRYKQMGYRFATVVHPAATVSEHAILDEGVQVMAGVVIQAGVRLGENTIINSGALVDHDCDIGRHCHLAPRSCLSGAVHVAEQTHIGVGATVIQGVRIGSQAVIGAGAIVVRDVDDNSTVRMASAAKTIEVG